MQYNPPPTMVPHPSSAQIATTSTATRQTTPRKTSTSLVPTTRSQTAQPAIHPNRSLLYTTALMLPPPSLAAATTTSYAYLDPPVSYQVPANHATTVVMGPPSVPPLRRQNATVTAQNRPSTSRISVADRQAENERASALRTSLLPADSSQQPDPRQHGDMSVGDQVGASQSSLSSFTTYHSGPVVHSNPPTPPPHEQFYETGLGGIEANQIREVGFGAGRSYGHSQ